VANKAVRTASDAMIVYQIAQPGLVCGGNVSFVLSSFFNFFHESSQWQLTPAFFQIRPVTTSSMVDKPRAPPVILALTVSFV
jgi:hypothetical protein